MGVAAEAGAAAGARAGMSRSKSNFIHHCTFGASDCFRVSGARVLVDALAYFLHHTYFQGFWQFVGYKRWHRASCLHTVYF